MHSCITVEPVSLLLICRVQHHLVVQGVDIPDQETAQQELEAVCGQLEELRETLRPQEGELVARAEVAQVL